MTDQPAPAADAGPRSAVVALETPIVRGEQTIAEITLRKPGAGELRGLTLVAVCNLDVEALIKLIPRISSPTLTAQEVAAMDPADLLSIGAEIGDFLSTKAMRASRGP